MLTLSQQAMARLADEVDAAQARGEVASKGQTRDAQSVGISDIGLTSQELSRARKFRDLDRDHPGVFEQAVAESVASGKPSKADVNRRDTCRVKGVPEGAVGANSLTKR